MIEYYYYWKWEDIGGMGVIEAENYGTAVHLVYAVIIPYHPIMNELLVKVKEIETQSI